MTSLMAEWMYSSSEKESHNSSRTFGPTGNFSSTRACAGDLVTVRGQQAKAAPPKTCAMVFQYLLSLPQHEDQSCHMPATLSMSSLSGSSGVCTVRSAECRATSRSRARCNAFTSRWPGPEYRTHQSTGCRGNARANTRYAPWESGWATLSASPSLGLALVEVAPLMPLSSTCDASSARCANCTTSAQLSTLDTGIWRPISLRINSANVIACSESIDPSA
mmetsp:Transcript_51030/g.137318  ORF Transcript_51030/g.137318 Transcript_51030/m.137318 type:complete len:220 (-) Transcript_51030:464-1123(-)